jgi:hypothetical protein
MRREVEREKKEEEEEKSNRKQKYVLTLLLSQKMVCALVSQVDARKTTVTFQPPL